MLNNNTLKIAVKIIKTIVLLLILVVGLILLVNSWNFMENTAEDLSAVATQRSQISKVATTPTAPATSLPAPTPVPTQNVIKEVRHQPTPVAQVIVSPSQADSIRFTAEVNSEREDGVQRDIDDKDTARANRAYREQEIIASRIAQNEARIAANLAEIESRRLLLTSKRALGDINGELYVARHSGRGYYPGQYPFPPATEDRYEEKDFRWGVSIKTGRRGRPRVGVSIGGGGRTSRRTRR